MLTGAQLYRLEFEASFCPCERFSGCLPDILSGAYECSVGGEVVLGEVDK